jgi:hypothetical protein
MTKMVLIDYIMDNKQQSVMIPVNYEITQLDDIRTISCTIQQNSGYSIPGWLRPFRFSIKSIEHNGSYETLYSDYASVQNLDAALFIDRASEIILLEEAKVIPLVVKSRKKV